MRNLSCALQAAALLLFVVSASAQTPFTPPPIVNGGQVVPLYPPGSPFLNAARVGEPEQNNMACLAEARECGGGRLC